MSDTRSPSLDDDPELTHSPLEREVTRDGVTVRVEIYRGAEEDGWLLEVEHSTGGSTVWEDRFDTDQQALDEAMRAIDEDGIESFALAETSAVAAGGWWDEDGAAEAVSLVKQAMEASSELLDFHTTCGLLAAVVTAPEIVPPSAWLEYVKGEHVFHGLEEVEGFTGGLMQLYNAIARALDAHDARCVPGPDDAKAIEQFCAGYVTIAANDETWEANARVFVELLPMFALSGSTSVEKVGELLPSAKQDPEAWLRKAREELPNTVLSMFDVWAGARRAAANRAAQGPAQARREGFKVGRNDPCPCGSGKKYKKCCAN